MKICVVGAGAIGGMLAVKFAHTGHDVSVIARGAHLDAIRDQGLRYIETDDEILAENLNATDDLDAIREQDVVLLAVKGHQIEAVAEQLTSMLAAEGVIVTLQNGIPWWYFQKLDGEYSGNVVRTVDPDGKLAATIDPDRIVGCIAYPAASLESPGVIRHIEGNRFPLGELDGSKSDRLQMLCDMFIDAGFKSRLLTDIRSEIWLKLWGNLTFNPVSALTHSTLVDICEYPPTRNLAAQMMTEAQQIAAKLGVTFRISLDKRIEGARGVGKHKTSMLQDLEAGKPLEIDGMLGVVIELGEQTGTPTPTLDAVMALVGLLDKTLREESVRIGAQPL